jgi:hypothetical protein
MDLIDGAADRKQGSGPQPQLPAVDPDRGM